MQKKKTKANAGETMTEVLVSMVIFLLMMGILQGAISYSSASLRKNKEIRANTSAILQGLQSQKIVQEGPKKPVTFVATDGNFTSLGYDVFSVNTRFDTKIVTYTDSRGQEQTVSFCVYGSVPDPGQTAEGSDAP